MSPFLCNNFLSEITKCIFKHPSIKPHIIIVWVMKIILFAFLSLLDLFKSHKSSRVKKSSSRNLWRIHLSSFSLFFFFLLILTGYNHSSSPVSALWSAFKWDLRPCLTSQPWDDSGLMQTPLHITVYPSCDLLGCTQEGRSWHSMLPILPSLLQLLLPQ